LLTSDFFSLHRILMLGTGAFPPTPNPYVGLEMLSAQADTYPDARDQVCDSLRILQSMHEEWKHLLRTEDTAMSMRFQHLHREIAGEICGVGEDLDGISKVMAVVERSRGTYPVDDAEMSKRRAFLRTSLAALEAIKDSFANSQTSAKQNVDRQAAEGASTPSPAWRAAGQDEAEALRVANERFLGAQRQDQQQLHAQQDDILVDIGRSAKRLKDVASEANKEIKFQNVLLHEFEQDVDRETGKLNTATKKLGRLLNTSDRSLLCTIIGLVALALLLLFLVLS